MRALCAVYCLLFVVCARMPHQQTNKQRTNKQTNKQTNNKQTNQQTNKRTSEQTKKQTKKHINDNYGYPLFYLFNSILFVQTKNKREIKREINEN